MQQAAHSAAWREFDKRIARISAGRAELMPLIREELSEHIAAGRHAEAQAVFKDFIDSMPSYTKMTIDEITAHRSSSRTAAEQAPKFFSNIASLAENHWGKLAIGGAIMAAAIGAIVMSGKSKERVTQRRVNTRDTGEQITL